MIERLGGAIEAKWAQRGERQRVLDVPLAMVIGGLLRVICIRLRRGEHRPTRLVGGRLPMPLWFLLVLCSAVARWAARWLEPRVSGNFQ